MNIHSTVEPQDKPTMNDWFNQFGVSSQSIQPTKHFYFKDYNIHNFNPKKASRIKRFINLFTSKN